MRTIDLLNFRQGNRSAFELIFNVWYDSLCLFANRITGDLPASEDIVQEVFISLWENRGKIESEAHLKAFLYSVTRNKCLNYIKHEKIKEKFSQEQNFPVENEDFFIRYVISEETNRIIRQTSKELAPKCRRIFLLSLKGINNQEIASMLKISVNTVKTQKRIAYSIMKKKISILSLLLLNFI